MNEVARKGDFLMKKLLLIDGNSVLYRAFYGVTLLTTSKGVYTNAVYGFAMMIMQLLQDEQPSHVLVALGYEQQEIRSSVRFSFSPYQSLEEIIEASRVVIRTVQRLQK